MFDFKQRTIAETVKILPIAMPKVVISSEAITKMQLYIDGCDTEIGWLGTAVKKDNTYYILDMYLFNQEVHSTTTEITPEGLTTFAENLLEKENGVEIWNNLKVWGHSHVRMAVSPSGQDDSQMETFKQGGHDWFIRIIGNKNGDLKIDIYNYETGVVYNDMKFAVSMSKEESEIKIKITELENMIKEIRSAKAAEHKVVIDAEIKEKVKKKTYAYEPAYSGAAAYAGSQTNIDDFYMYQLHQKRVAEQKKINGNVVKTPNYRESNAFGMLGLESEEDVKKYIDDDVLEQIATCRNIYEMNQILKDNDYVPTDYDTYEKNLIMEVAKKGFRKACGSEED